MNLHAEITIDIDPNRRIWLASKAEDVAPEQVPEIAAALQEAVTTQALAVHALVVPQDTEPQGAAIVAAASRRGKVPDVPPSQRRPRPEDPESMRTFGEDEEDESHAD